MKYNRILLLPDRKYWLRDSTSCEEDSCFLGDGRRYMHSFVYCYKL